MEPYDFCGWATKNNLLCSDGVVIRQDAFKHNDGKRVPLVWNHQHGESESVLGHAILENRPEGVYAYGYFNDTESGKNAKMLVEHGDVEALSICANRLKKDGRNVMHGEIRELSLVLAGANPGAFIESVIKHGEMSDDEAIIYTGESIEIYHAENETKKENTMAEKEKTIQDVYDTFTEEQKQVVNALVGMAMEERDNNDEEEDDGEMKQNVFEKDEVMTAVDKGSEISHAERMEIIGDAKRYGSMKESALAHGIEDIEFLFPDAKTLTNTPQFIERDMGWVKMVMNRVRKTPFSRIKSMFADITEDEARARGYIKGNMKKEEVFSLLKRTTDPTTIYKKQKMHRDDVIDITDFDVIAWLKAEMRKMLDEEIARAILVGDGRLTSDDDHISEDNIRPIWKEAELYTVHAKWDMASTAKPEEKAKEFIKSVIRARKEYKGSGNPDLFTTEDMLTECLLLTDSMGRDLYTSVEQLAKKLRVKEIITVPVMEGLTRTDSGSTYDLFGIVVNLDDYTVGADKGGSVNMFEDFDINYNAQKYLIETRCSGALIKPKSAIIVEMKRNPS